MQADLVHASRLALIGQLHTSILHEMQQPLTAARLRAAAGREQFASGQMSQEAIGEAFGEIERNLQFATEIVGRLRALANKRPLEMLPTDINEALAEVAWLVEIEARSRGVTLRMDLADELPVIAADKVSLKHAVLDLLVNGMEATEGAKRRQVEVSSRPAADAIEIRVSDTGGGIAPVNRTHLFHAFFTTKPQGTGLGLTITRSIVEAHGGTVWAEDSEAGGACFCIRIPALATVRQ